MARQQARRYRPMAQGAAGHASCCLPQSDAARENHGEARDDLAGADLQPQGPHDPRGEAPAPDGSTVPRAGRLADIEKPGGPLAMPRDSGPRDSGPHDSGPHDAEPQGVRRGSVSRRDSNDLGSGVST